MTEQKKPYVKPELERVKLVPDEAVLGGCKTDAGGGLLPAGNCATASCVANATS